MNNLDTIIKELEGYKFLISDFSIFQGIDDPIIHLGDDTSLDPRGDRKTVRVLKHRTTGVKYVYREHKKKDDGIREILGYALLRIMELPHTVLPEVTVCPTAATTHASLIPRLLRDRKRTLPRFTHEQKQSAAVHLALGDFDRTWTNYDSLDGNLVILDNAGGDAIFRGNFDAGLLCYRETGLVTPTDTLQTFSSGIERLQGLLEGDYLKRIVALTGLSGDAAEQKRIELERNVRILPLIIESMISGSYDMRLSDYYHVQYTHKRTRRDGVLRYEGRDILYSYMPGQGETLDVAGTVVVGKAHIGPYKSVSLVTPIVDRSEIQNIVRLIFETDSDLSSGIKARDETVDALTDQIIKNQRLRYRILPASEGAALSSVEKSPASDISVVSRETILEEIAKAEAGKYKGIIVYPPTIDWGTLHQRPHQLTKYFARQGYLAFYCTPNNDTLEVEGYRRLEPGLYLTDRISDLFDIKKPIVVITWPFLEPLVYQFTGDPTIVYEVIDELSLFGGDTNPQIGEMDKRLTDIADVVTTTADILHTNKKKERPDTVLVENAADLGHFLRPVSDNEIPPEMQAIASQGKPIVGYYGALAHWINYSLVLDAARQRPDLNFVFIGRDYERDGSLQSVLAAAPPNVFYIGGPNNNGVPYEQLPGYLRAFSVAMIPFDHTSPIIQSTSPVKLFEYMAGGKPVVATDFPEARKYSCVRRATDLPSFIDSIDAALAEKDSPEFIEQLHTTARENSWTERVTRIEEALARAKTPHVRRFTLFQEKQKAKKMLEDTATELLKRRQYEAAIFCYEQLIGIAPEASLFDFEVGKIYLRHLRQPANAITHFRREIRKNPQSGWVHALLGEAYLQNGDFQHGLKALEDALHIPDYQGSTRHAFTLLERHRYIAELREEAHKHSLNNPSLALEIYGEILFLDPRDRLADYEIGRIYTYHGKYEKALPYAMEATAKLPTSPWTHIALGETYLHLGRKNDAKRSFNTALTCTRDQDLRVNIERWTNKCS